MKAPRMKINGVEWDNGNWPKCGKHGLSQKSIEWVLKGRITIFDDPNSTDKEKRFRAIGKDDSGKYTFIVFCIRRTDDNVLMRPISARHMHEKEINYYEQQI